MKSLNVRETVNRFHEEARRSHDSEEILAELSDQIQDLRGTHEKMYRLRASVGAIPPQPDTLRARIGAPLLLIVRRMLFWYTPQIVAFNEVTTNLAEQTCDTFDKTAAALERLERKVHELRLETRASLAIGSRQARYAENRESESRASDLFEFELRKLPESPWDLSQPRLGAILSVLQSLKPPLPEGLWVDLGCNRGDWCAMVRDAGIDVLGVDPNAAAVEHSRDAGFNVVHGGLMSWMASANEGSVSVLSAFHVLEHSSFETVFRLAGRAASVLAPGGVFVAVCANPGNLLNSAERLWQDPANRILIPSNVMTALLRHFGFEIVNVEFGSAAPPAEHFPWGELEIVGRLNDRFYGPSAYTVIARISERRPARVSD